MVDLRPIHSHLSVQQDFCTVAGDVSKSQTLQHTGVFESSLVVVSVSSDGNGIELVCAIGAIKPLAVRRVRSRYVVNASKIRPAGADQVVREEAHERYPTLFFPDRFFIGQRHFESNSQ